MPAVDRERGLDGSRPLVLVNVAGPRSSEAAQSNPSQETGYFRQQAWCDSDQQRVINSGVGEALAETRPGRSRMSI